METINQPPSTGLRPLAEVLALRQRVTELERELAALRATTVRDECRHLEALVANSSDAIWSVDRQHRLVYFNPNFRRSFHEIFGFFPQVGDLPERLISEPDAAQWHAWYNRVMTGESFFVQQDFPLLGKTHTFDISLHPIVVDGQVTGAGGFSRDVTEYKHSQDQVRSQSSLLQSIIDNISDGVVVSDLSGKFLVFNPAAERILGVGSKNVDSSDWSQTYGLFAEDRVTPFAHEQLPLIRAIKGEQVDDAQIFVRHPIRPEGVWLSVNARPFFDKDGVRRGGVAVFRDVTESHRNREALEAEQQFLEQLLLAHERDRQLMAYEIHDGLVQDVTGAIMHLESCWPRKSAPTKESGSFELALKLLRDTLDEGRRLISGLRPPILDEMGIVAAIEYLASEFAAEGHGAIRFSHDVHFERLEPLLEGTMFRIVQEGLTNIKRHSHSSTASIDLTQVGDLLQLQIRDRGVGFDPAQVDKRRFGLKGIRERARLLRGRAIIDSKIGRGTKIFVELPITYALHWGTKRSTE